MGYFVKNRQLQSGSSGVVLPAGGSDTRPDAPAFGLIRYNTDLAAVEFFNGSVFQTLSSSGSINYTVDSFTGDGSTTDFTMTLEESSVFDVIVFIGSIYQTPGGNSTPQAYTVSGFNIEFSSAPPNGVPINVIHTSS